MLVAAADVVVVVVVVTTGWGTLTPRSRPVSAYLVSSGLVGGLSVQTCVLSQLAEPQPALPSHAARQASNCRVEDS